MNNQLQIFKYETNEIRTITKDKDGEPWFVLKDVCDVLGLSSPHKVAERLDDDEKGRNLIPTLGGEQELTIINESGLYNVILRSDKPQAKPFRKWVTSEVLPSIRKHGMYVTSGKIEELIANPDVLIEVLQKLKEEQAALAAENERLQLVEAKYAGQTNIDGLYKVSDIAKDYGISAQKLNKWLSDLKIQYKPAGSATWVLYLQYAKESYTTVRQIEVQPGYVKNVLLWTPKGRDFISDLVDREQPNW